MSKRDFLLNFIVMVVVLLPTIAHGLSREKSQQTAQDQNTYTQLNAIDKDSHSRVKTQFDSLFSFIIEQLSNRQKYYINNPTAYYHLISKSVAQHWDSRSTLRALIGNENLTSLGSNPMQTLEDNFKQTLIRYAFEGLEKYAGQVFSVAAVNLDHSRGNGGIKVLMQSRTLPNFKLDLMIERDANNLWKAVDLRFKGLSYIAIKKHKYQRIVKKHGFDGLIRHLSNKNREYFDRLCGVSTSNIPLGQAPC